MENKNMLVGGVVVLALIVLAFFVMSNRSGQVQAPVNTETIDETIQEVDETKPEEETVMEEKSGDDAAEGQEDDVVMKEEVKTFELTGKNFAFSVGEIRVKKGDKVKINFSSTGGFHDWVVDEFDARTEQVDETQGSTSVEFIADKAGKFEYYCSVGKHRQMGMVGKLIVE